MGPDASGMELGAIQSMIESRGPRIVEINMPSVPERLRWLDLSIFGDRSRRRSPITVA